ncbi:hypothetical protein HY407_01235 [Candidatus Gottesmanbacteria bacterium]|nr:hypothetical protein [Candidatus Gottesmanbacteria bacterium]
MVIVLIILFLFPYLSHGTSTYAANCTDQTCIDNPCNPFCVQCGGCRDPDKSGVCNPIIPGLCGTSNVGPKFGGLITSLVSVFLIIAAIFALLNLLLGGLGWITSGGDKAGVDAARSRIQNAILGLFIVAISWTIFIFVTGFLGITAGGPGFRINLPTLF